MKIKSVFLFISGLFVLTATAAAAVFLVQNRQLLQAKAGDCHQYTFYVTASGAVTVTNNQSFSVPGQSISVIINGSPWGFLKAPGLDSGQSSTISTVTTPISGRFSWSVVGSDFCSNSGSHF